MIVKAALTLSLLLVGQSASAHRINEYLQATVLSLSVDRVQASMRMIPGVEVASAVIADIDANGDGIFSDDEERAYAQRVVADLSLTQNDQTVQTKVQSWSFPQPIDLRDGVGEIHIEYSANLPRGGADRRLILANHRQDRTSVYLMNVLTPNEHDVQIVAQKRNEQQSVYELDYRDATDVAVQAAAATASLGSANDFQWAPLFHLGMHHIAEGKDHLLFLLTLLLPAPLLLAGSRWGPPAAMRQCLSRILGLVTAFSVGHSLTLGLAALGILHVPSRPIEMLVAVSIFVSALHAWRPIAVGRAVGLASFFGLIHGLAFATSLEQLGLSHWQRLAGILAFNLGIETMQLMVVAAVLPSLILLSHTRAYPLFRISGAVFAASASLGWIIERLFDVETPIDSIMNTLTSHALWIAVGLLLVSLTYGASRINQRYWDAE